MNYTKNKIDLATYAAINRLMFAWYQIKCRGRNAFVEIQSSSRDIDCNEPEGFNAENVAAALTQIDALRRVAAGTNSKRLNAACSAAMDVLKNQLLDEETRNELPEAVQESRVESSGNGFKFWKKAANRGMQIKTALGALTKLRLEAGLSNKALFKQMAGAKSKMNAPTPIVGIAGMPPPQY